MKREESAEEEAERRRRQDAIQYARTHDASAGLSKAEHKQKVVAEAAERKRMEVTQAVFRLYVLAQAFCLVRMHILSL